MTGKWTIPGIPHKGWTPIRDVIDLGPGEDNMAICEMCEVQEIRYVHTMAHPDYPEPLRCGCICAAFMEEGYVEGHAADVRASRAHHREQAVRNKSKRRESFLTRKWRRSRNGNEYLNLDHATVVIFPARGRWKAMIKDRWTGESEVTPVLYPSREIAKREAFEAMEKLRELRNEGAVEDLDEMDDEETYA